MNNILHADNVYKSFHDGERELEVLRGVNLEINAGETVAILGRSGTGKTTLLSILGLLDRPGSGSLHLCGNDVSSLSEAKRTKMRAQNIGFVFQHYHLLSEFNALENITLAASSQNMETKAHARELLNAVGLSERTTHKPSRLSGGERQRVAIARSLINHPQLLLCDEPTGNLDPHTGQEVLDVFWRAVKMRNTAMILVTHDMDIASRADRVLTLREGVLE